MGLSNNTQTYPTTTNELADLDGRYWDRTSDNLLVWVLYRELIAPTRQFCLNAAP